MTEDTIQDLQKNVELLRRRIMFLEDMALISNEASKAHSLMIASLGQSTSYIEPAALAIAEQCHIDTDRFIAECIPIEEDRYREYYHIPVKLRIDYDIQEIHNTIRDTIPPQEHPYDESKTKTTTEESESTSG